MNTNDFSRRRFLKRAGLIGSALALPTIIPASVLGANAPSKRVALGHIGVGGQGGGLLGGFLGLPQGQSIAVCDPLRERREKAAQLVEQRYAAAREQGGYKGCKAYNDFRELIARDDIDAVVVATPDHWHVPIAVAAVRAGKDVYVEKPLSISMELDKAMRQAVHQHGAVFQYGTQQRSFDQHCGFAAELVRNGYIGEVKAIHVVAPNGETGGRRRTAAGSRRGWTTTCGWGPRRQPPTLPTGCWALGAGTFTTTRLASSPAGARIRSTSHIGATRRSPSNTRGSAGYRPRACSTRLWIGTFVGATPAARSSRSRPART